MTLSKLVLRSMRKNVKQYFLYFFALIFSVTLCFSFTTLYHNPTVVKLLEESGTATAGFKAGTFVLYFIIIFFVIYANQLFMKRRSKEIGLYQMIGMTKGLIIRLIAIENLILFIIAVSIGMVLGFICSRIFALILIKMMGVSKIIELMFSFQAFKQSVMIFILLLLIILIQTTMMVYRTTLMALFQASKKADEKIKPFNVFQMLMGLAGLLLIIYGYYESTTLFDLEKSKFHDIFLHMIVILGTTIFGTFLFFRFSVAFILNIVRKFKKGHLSLKDVVALTPVMHRMKGNAKSLTLITILTGLAVGIMTLAYITYYSSEELARNYSPYDYILLNNQGEEFLDQLTQKGIPFEKHSFDVSYISFNFQDVTGNLSNSNLLSQDADMFVIPLKDYKQISRNAALEESEVFITSLPDWLSNIVQIKEGMQLPIKYGNQETVVHIKEIREGYILSGKATFLSPLLIVNDEMFEEIKKNQEATFYSQIGINLKNNKDIHEVEEVYKNLSELRKVEIHGVETIPLSYFEERKGYLSANATIIFIAGFLGLAFLLTTGCILYFKQMAEAEEEKGSYTILRKIGFSTSDLMKGIIRKQYINFGIPLLIGLLHSYFAVKSGWFLFGTELVIPLVVIMSIYVVMYGIFAVLSTLYYKKVIVTAL